MRPLTMVILLCLCSILLSCGDSSESGLTKAEEKLFVETYVNLVLATWDQQVDEDSLAALRQGVFDEMGIDEQRFMELSHQAEAHPERWVEVWDQIVRRLEASEEQTVAE
jgi:hypothetical protein